MAETLSSNSFDDVLRDGLGAEDYSDFQQLGDALPEGKTPFGPDLMESIEPGLTAQKGTTSQWTRVPGTDTGDDPDEM